MELLVNVAIAMYVIVISAYVINDKLTTIQRLRRIVGSDVKFLTKEMNRINNELGKLNNMTEAINGEMLESFNCQNEYIDVRIDELKYKLGLKDKLLVGDVTTPDYAIKDLDTIYERRGLRKDRRQN